MITAEKIRQTRKALKKTQEEMATMLGVSKPQLAGIEQGKRPVGKAVALAFEKLFPDDQSYSRQSALDALNQVVATKDTQKIWALVDFLKRI